MSNGANLPRRDLIKRAAIAGVGVWTAPLVIESLASPAAAASAEASPFPCSYASIVFTIGDKGPYAVKIEKNTTTCANDNSTSGDDPLSVDCGLVTYTNGCDGTSICGDGAAVPAYNAFPCPFTLTVGSGGSTVVTAKTGVVILFVAVHDGTCPGHFCTDCSPGSSFSVTSGHCDP